MKVNTDLIVKGINKALVEVDKKLEKLNNELKQKEKENKNERIKMREYKITYKIFSYPYYYNNMVTYNATIRATDENNAIEILKKELKNNGHRLKEIIDIKEMSNNENKNKL